MSTPAKLIVYACPMGALAEQVEQFYTASRERFGPNTAHAFPPHITLTGFFHDDAGQVPFYAAALGAAHSATMARRPADAVQITALATEAEFHGLLIVSPWLERLAADFKTRAVSPTRRDEVRPKTNLHLSLAYGFRPADGPGLGALARELVDPRAPVSWELRLYERTASGEWVAHATWSLGA